jgi:nucleotide-binding universal stress UspA family protein
VYKKILLPLDGSEFAERVIPLVEPLAEKLGSALVLLQVTTALEVLMAEITPGVAGTPGVVVDPQPILDAEQSAAAEYLGRWTERLRGKGYTVEAEHPAGHAPTVIIERARALGADLIAMSTHGRSGLRRMFLGSVADAVLRHAQCPVLLVRVSDDKGTAGEHRA